MKNIIKSRLLASLFVVGLFTGFACIAVDPEIVAQKTEELFKICEGKNDDANGAKKLIQDGANVNAKGKYEQTPLHWAAKNGHTEVAKILIANCAYVSEKDNDGWTPLHFAAKNGHTEVAKILIANCADFNAKDSNEWTPLHWAAKNDHTEVAKILIEKSADVNAKDDDRRTPLYWACYNYNLKIIELLLEWGANVDGKVLEKANEEATINKKFELLELVKNFDEATLYKKFEFIDKEKDEQTKKLFINRLSNKFKIEYNGKEKSLNIKPCGKLCDTKISISKDLYDACKTKNRNMIISSLKRGDEIKDDSLKLLTDKDDDKILNLLKQIQELDALFKDKDHEIKDIFVNRLLNTIKEQNINFKQN